MIAKSTRTFALVLLNLASCPFLYLSAAVVAVSALYTAGVSMLFIVLSQVAVLAVIASVTVAWMALRDVDGSKGFVSNFRVVLIVLSLFCFCAAAACNAGGEVYTKQDKVAAIVALLTAAEGMLVSGLLMEFGRRLLRPQPAEAAN